MAKDRVVEMTLVVQIDRHIDEDLEVIIKEALAAEGIQVRELTRLELTGTIDLPRVWLPTKPGELPPSGPPPEPPPKRKPPPPPPPEKYVPPWRRKKK